MGSSEGEYYRTTEEAADGDDAISVPDSDNVNTIPFEDTPSEAQLSTTSTWAEDSELKSQLEKVSVVTTGWKFKGKLAPRMSSLAEGTDDDDGLCSTGMPGVVMATHSFFSVCGLTHGDISPANICFYYDKEGKMVGVINDFDHHRAEEIRPHAR